MDGINGLEQVKQMFADIEANIRKSLAEIETKTGDNVGRIKNDLETRLTEVTNKLAVIEQNIAKERAADLPGVDPKKFSFARWAGLTFFPECRENKDYGYELDVMREMNKRDAVASDGSQGGFAVPTNLAQYIVEPAIANMPLRKLGMTVLNGLRGVFEIPGVSSLPASGHTSETGTPTKLNFGWTLKRMTPHRAAGYTIVSRRLLRDSPLAIEQWIRDKLSISLAIKIESGCITGTGGDNEPTGLLNTTGMTSLTDAITGQVTVKQLRQMKTDLEEVDFGPNQDALVGGSFGYLTRPIVVEGICMARSVFYSGQTVGKGFQINNAPITEKTIEEVTGAMIVSTTLVPSASSLSSVVYGNWKHAVCGLWSGLEVRASDVASDGTNHSLINGTVMIVADQDYDFTLDLPAAFCKTSTAAAARSAWTEY